MIDRRIVVAFAVAVGCTHADPVSVATPPKPPVVAAAPIDAAPAVEVVDAPPPAPAVLDPMTLPEWPTAKGPVGTDATELYAVDVDVDYALTSFGGGRAVIVRALGKDKRITGRLNAPSREAAFVAFATAAGVDPVAPKIVGRGATVSLQFARAPGLDLLRLIGDTGRLNIVVRGAMPDLDVVTKRQPWDGVLDAIAIAVNRTIEKHGNTYYLLAAGEHTTPPPKLGTSTVSLDTKDATITEAAAAVSAITDLPVHACGTDRVTLRIKRVAVEEAARALSFVGGVPIEKTSACPLIAAPKEPGKNDRLAAIATVGTKRVAVFTGPAGSYLVRTAPGTEIGDGYVTIATLSYLLYPNVDLGPPPPEGTWMSSVQRTAMVMSIGRKWSAIVETSTGPFNVEPLAPGPWNAGDDPRVVPPIIDRRGVTFADVLVPLRK